MEGYSSGFLIPDSLKLVKLDKHLVIIHDCLDSEPAEKQNKSADDDDTGSCRCFHAMKSIYRKRQDCRRSSIKRVMMKMANHCTVMAVLVGAANPESDFKFWAKQLAPTTTVIAIRKGRIICGRPCIYQLKNCSNSKLSCYLKGRSNKFSKDEELIEDETCLNTVKISGDGNGGYKTGSLSLNHGKLETYSRSQKPVAVEKLPEDALGWPLLRSGSLTSQSEPEYSEAKGISVVQWSLSLPERPTSALCENQTDPCREGISQSSNNFANSLPAEQKDEKANQARENESVNTGYHSELGHVHSSKGKELSSSDSCPVVSMPEVKPGWPLNRIGSTSISQDWRQSEVREMSVVQWTMSLPHRSTSVTTETQSDIEVEENAVLSEISYPSDDNDKEQSSDTRRLPAEFERLLTSKSSGYRRFSYAELQCATSGFSPENLIGTGGCSSVYKGSLPNGKLVAVKILKSYKEAWTDFSLEMDIMSSLKHKNITPLVGVCMEDDMLISVYEFITKGSLDTYLHGSGKKRVLPWEVRFRIAIVVAEAINFLHSGCSRPVIHRDVKSSNILLSDDFQPQLSDFGLAVWGPRDASYEIDMDVVGTFGYMAPEYVMHGKVSDKIDVFAFGVVLLELLTAKKPIYSKALQGQESLVKWAKPLMNSGNYRALVDPKLARKFDIVQMHRMVLAAALCISQSDRFRPNIKQILQLLKGEMDAKDLIQIHANRLKSSSNLEEDESSSLKLTLEPQMDLAPLLHASEDPKQQSIAESKRRSSLAECLNEPDAEFPLPEYFRQKANYRRLKFGDFLLTEN